MTWLQGGRGAWQDGIVTAHRERVWKNTQKDAHDFYLKKVWDDFWQVFSEMCTPLWLKMPSISMLLREWAIQSVAQGTRPSRAGERSVVLTKHQSGLSWSLSSTSTVCPLRTVSSLLLPAMKSWMTTVSSQPPDN